MSGLVCLVIVVLTLSTAAAQKHLACYYGSWATYRPGLGKCDVENLNPHLCTHAIYAFAGLNGDGSVRVIDAWNDLEQGCFQRFCNLRVINPNLKTLIAIGGPMEGSTTFSRICANNALRTSFVNHVHKFVTHYGFDGVDLAWEFPGQRGGALEDKVNFVSLVRELKDKLGPDLLLTVAVSASIDSVAKSYDVPELIKYVDLINLMTYDYHGPWEVITGQHAPLYDSSSEMNVDASVNYWLSQGAAASKLLLGMGFYGRTWTLQNYWNTGLRAPAIGLGMAGPYTQQNGFLGYNEICEMQKSEGWIIQWNTEQKVPFCFKDSQWVGYDNVDSIRIKTEYVNEKELGGAVVWALETDDFRNICGDGAFPLLSTINATLV